MNPFAAFLGWWRRLRGASAPVQHGYPAAARDASAAGNARHPTSASGRVAPSLAAVGRPAAASPNEVFTPTRPRAGRRTLVGRQLELQRILDGILDDTAHVVLYSERGRGKTSLSNLAIEQLRRRGAVVARCACEAETTFDTMIRALARDLPRSLLAQGDVGGDPAGGSASDEQGCEAVLPPRGVRPADVAAIPAALNCDIAVFVVDEFDRVTDLETRTRLADTIKLLSDRGLRLYFMVVGVSDTLEQIIGQHPSIQRNIVGVHLPLLRDDEIGDMLTKGGQQAGIAFNPQATGVVQAVARGMPYMAQLLGLRIAQSALRHADEDEASGTGAQVHDSDVLTAVQRLLDETSSTVLSTHAALSAEPRLALMLLRLAGAEQDQWGRMVVAKSADGVSVGGVRLAQPHWQRLLDAGVLVQPDGEAGAAQFRDRPLVYHVLLLAARKVLRTRMAGPAADVDQLDMAAGR